MAVIVLLHTFVITFFTVTSDDFKPLFITGDRVMVSKIAHKKLQKGDFLVYTDSVHYYLSRIEGMPGDTIIHRGHRFRIPWRCCQRCGCPDCRYILVNTGRQRLLVHQHLIVGKAYAVK